MYSALEKASQKACDAFAKIVPGAMISSYDVEFVFESGRDLPIGDYTSSDPYLVVDFGGGAKFKTRHINATLHPTWNEDVLVSSLAAGARVLVDVFDKDTLKPDDLLGRVEFTFQPQEGKWRRELPVIRPNGKEKGVITVSFEAKPSLKPGPIRCTGPVKYRRHLCVLSGMLANADANLASYYTYKMSLFNVDEAFEGMKQHWNEKYSAAQAIFGNSILGVNPTRTMILGQHKTMYMTENNTVYGKCYGAADFFSLLNNGRSQDIQRYYTYVIMADGMRFSETGAAFFRDMMSKHAMHSSASEEVYFAGEFTIEPSTSPGNDLGYKLCIDNNSGTYAPPADRLHMLQRLFVNNFPGMEVEALDREDPRVKLYQSHCPRR